MSASSTYDLGGKRVVITGASQGIGAGTHTMRLKATGTNPVALELQIDGLTTITFNDSDTNRKQTGTSGVGGYSFTGSTVWVGDITVDNLVTGGGGTGLLRAMMQHGLYASSGGRLG